MSVFELPDLKLSYWSKLTRYDGKYSTDTPPGMNTNTLVRGSRPLRNQNRFVKGLIMILTDRPGIHGPITWSVGLEVDKRMIYHHFRFNEPLWFLVFSFGQF